MIAKVYSAIPHGYNGQIIEVEGDSARSLPSFNIVGMANKTITEARERVRAALANSDFRFPDRRVTVNLAPADLVKDGTSLDLAIALAVLALSQQLPAANLHGRLFVGELSLNGQTRPSKGIINIVETAVQHGFREIYVPVSNLEQARLVPHAAVIGVNDLKSLVLHLLGVQSLPVYKSYSLNNNFSAQPPTTSVTRPVVKNTCSGVESQSASPNKIQFTSSNTHVVKNTYSEVGPHFTSPSTNVVENTNTDASANEYLLDYVKGQSLAKRALIIALAGGHNLLFTGPPGAGKTMLAKVARNLLPPVSPTERIEITKLHNLNSSTPIVLCERPFRSPHHTASASAIIGGGSNTLPGEISLAHRGILFLDELPEFARPVLEALRQPLEDGEITITRVHQRTTYPARFLLIGTMNPCPCGYFGDPTHPCSCSPAQISNYQKRLSGPILDRIDLILHLKRTSSDELATHVVKNNETPTEHLTAQHQIIAARTLQAERYRHPDQLNSNLSPIETRNYIKLDAKATELLRSATKKLDLSTRSYFKILKVARTIADLDTSAVVQLSHIAEALSFRQNT